MPGTQRLVTAPEFARLSRDGFRLELVAGRVVPMTPVGYLHGRIVSRLIVLIAQALRPGQADIVTEVGFTLSTGPTR